ncbi:unnamed protein product [Linum trigynum]|uniref:Uncharacterized protein n=1 Tax=Linum trigynum TaxID=586398 RepID=A0AAV2EBM1_9ROSI
MLLGSSAAALFEIRRSAFGSSICSLFCFWVHLRLLYLRLPLPVIGFLFPSVPASIDLHSRRNSLRRFHSHEDPAMPNTSVPESIDLHSRLDFRRGEGHYDWATPGAKREVVSVQWRRNRRQ